MLSYQILAKYKVTESQRKWDRGFRVLSSSTAEPLKVAVFKLLPRSKLDKYGKLKWDLGQLQFT